ETAPALTSPPRYVATPSHSPVARSKVLSNGRVGFAPAAASFDLSSQHDHATQHFASLHAVEGLFHPIERDRLRHEALEIEPALQVQVDQHREVAAREAIAVPTRLAFAAATDEL